MTKDDGITSLLKSARENRDVTTRFMRRLDAHRLKLTAGLDFPCALHKGPAGDCNETNCRCY